MNKHQLACEAALASQGLDLEGKQRMAHMIKGDKPFNANNILAKQFGVSRGYIIEAKKLLRNDPDRFNQVLLGEELLPIVRQKGKDKGKESFALYRAFDEQDVLLYIGKTWSVGQRMGSHAGNSKWWDEMVVLKVQRGFNSYEELTQAETLAIRHEHPKYNLEAKYYNRS